MGTNGLPIDDAMVDWVLDGALDEEYVEWAALVQMLRQHGFEGCGSWDVVAAVIGTWNVEIDRNGRIATADLRAAVMDGRIAPRLDVSEAEWIGMELTTNPDDRRRTLDSMLDRTVRQSRYYRWRMACLQKVSDEVHREIWDQMGLGELLEPEE